MKVHYDKDEDILMIVLPHRNKKIDDTLETENSLVSIAEDGTPLMVEIFEASKFFAAESRVLPKEIKQKFFSASA